MKKDDTPPIINVYLFLPSKRGEGISAGKRERRNANEKDKGQGLAPRYKSGHQSEILVDPNDLKGEKRRRAGAGNATSMTARKEGFSYYAEGKKGDAKKTCPICFS